MKDDECVREIGSACSPKTLQEATESGKSQLFEACLPFGGKLYSQGGYVNYEAGTPPPDGVYTAFTVKNGCITEAGQADISTYTATPCAPVPNPCDCEDGGGGSTPISPTAGNLSRLDATGALLTQLNAVAGDGIAITGKGTTADPLIIEANSGALPSTIINAGNAALFITGAGSAEDPYVISHKEQTEAKSFNGFSFDKYGHLIDYIPPGTVNTINGILAGFGIAVDVDVSTGIATVELAQPLHPIAGEYQFGAYIVEYDEKNMVYNLRRAFTFPAGVYRFGLCDVTIDEYGNITAVNPLPSTVVSSSASRRYTAATTGATAFSFTTDKVSSFKIELDAPSFPATPVVLIDGTTVAGTLIGSTKYIALSAAMYAAGGHTVTINTNLAANTFVTVYLTTVV